jgi:hypothetical protein
MGLFGRNKSTDEQALERYSYMLRTAPPETIEQAHAEAFAQLTPEQRRMVLQQLSPHVPAAERASVEQNGANPQALARLATRAEMRQPGTLTMGGVMAGSLLSSIAGAVIGSMIAREFLSGSQEDWQSAETDPASAEGDVGGDFGGGFDT